MRFYYRFRGNFYPYETDDVRSEREARAEIRRVWGLRSTRWIEVWPSPPRDPNAYRLLTPSGAYDVG